MARVPPISPLKMPRTGAFLALRSSAADGACGVHGYPCRHPGVDVLGALGQPVQAPEGGKVVAQADGSSPPWVGYGPWLIVILGDSGKYHLLGHLAPGSSTVAVGQRVEMGQVVGRIGSAGHTHWEVRTRLTPPAGMTNQENNMDPVVWVAGFSLLTIGLAAVVGYGVYRWLA